MRSTVRRIRSLTLALALAALGCFAVAAPAEAAPDASASIINGKPAVIEDWPWQVAVAATTTVRPGRSPWYRTFCGGSLVAPDVVLTASHCAIEMLKGKVGDFSVITGRTNLNNEAAGEEVLVTAIYFPRTSKGAIRYRTQPGWDVALLRLGHAVGQETIKLLGPDEQAIVKPGRRLVETGWGTTITGKNYSPKTLKVGGTNIQPGGICRNLVGSRYFKSELQICLGDSRGNQANCYGDSGGPAVVATLDGYRQVGVTSFGTADDCAGLIPNVDVLVGGNSLRGWVGPAVQALSGLDPVGSGATGSEIKNLCHVPAVRGLTAGRAKERLRAGGCSQVRVKRRGHGNQVSRLPALPGWLWDSRKPIRLVVGGR
ncbi:MAG: serine protease [Solirubrobacterales bacterium]|nr:serine protease [Solirubrobacterales bacterium]